MKVTRRDVIAFCIGMLTLLAIESVVNWKSSVTAFQKGYNEAFLER
ncbi:hypothetical protein MVI27_11185 [Chryseobacterium salipaludis]|nr:MULTISPECIES: hypothetical protein [Chryseobacterium]MCJ8498812.1 hypothetical protein [Chryseobacterium salipaludis]MCX3297380.1 hypothetical protein [Planobacterium sp. JC490]